MSSIEGSSCLQYETLFGSFYFGGSTKREAFSMLCDRMCAKIINWSTRFLSQRGKEVFIKDILQALPTNTVSYFLLPKSLCYELDQIKSKFWWQKNSQKKGMHWCRWSDLCYPKDMRGMGFRDLYKFNVALLAKQR